MAGKRKRRSGRPAATLAADLMLAPAVVALRLPAMLAEAGAKASRRPETKRAFAEKVAAAGQGARSAQMSLVRAALTFWPNVLAGRLPAALARGAAKRAAQVSLRPAAGKVRANFLRLANGKG